MNRIVMVTDPGSGLHAEADHLVIRRNQASVRTITLGSLSSIFLLGPVEVTPAAVRRCLRNGIDLVYLTRDGRYLGRLVGHGQRNADLRLAQYRTVTNPERCTALARNIVAGKMHNQRMLLLKRQRENPDEQVALALVRLRALMRDLARASTVDEIRGFEGAAAQVYFGVFGRLVRNPLFTFEGRNRRPPRDPINAMLSLGYTIVGALLEGDLEASGLDAALGCLHAPAYGRPSLMLDLLEEFRPLVVDTVVLRLVNRRQVVPADFGPPEGQSGWDEEEVEEKGAGTVDETAPFLPAALEEAASRAVGGVDSAGDDAPRGSRNVRAVFLRGTARKIFLGALLGRLRERLYDSVEEGNFEIRSILRNQVYRMARAFVDSSVPYVPFRWHD